MAPERCAAASKEVDELRKAGILRETRYQTWVANTVVVKKTDGAWRMCVDFIDINKACPKDCYSLPEIDWKVDSLSDFKLKCFLDAYKGYHQIQMAKEDKHKTAFHTPKEIGRNMEAYIDDMVIKSMDEEDMLADIQETFERLQMINMKLNPKKCSFGMEEGQFLRYIVSKQGIKANPVKIQALTSLERPKTIKEDASKKGFTWTREAEKAFEEMKRTVRWAIELGEHEIEYKPRNTIKAQFLTNFLADTQEEDDKTDFQNQEEKGKNTRWRLYTDRASSDNDSWARNQNKKADALRKLAALKFEHLPKKVLVEKLANKSIYEKQVAEVATKEENSWMTPIVKYLISGILPADKQIARKIRIKAQNYRIIDKILYKRSFLTPWLRLHTRQISILAKVTTLGYYWPSMHKDAAEIIQNRDTCKIHSPTSKLPKHDMTSVMMTWPFVTMGHPHSRPFAGSYWKGEILDNGNRLLHQLGGSKTFSKRHKEACRKTHMGARHMPFGNTPNDSIRQQETVQRKIIPATLRKAQNQASAHFYILPIGEQID
ncbi:hypothetical protein Tco_0098256 [Tanacetum coccineum]